MGVLSIFSRKEIAHRIDQRFCISQRRSTIQTEIRGGATTFLTMAYILFVNPQILKSAGLDPADVATATALVCALGTIALGWFANLPFAIGPGMGLNTFFATSVHPPFSLRQVLTAALLSGTLLCTLAALHVTTAVMKMYPLPLKTAVMVGIGLYQAFIGARQIGLIVPSHTEDLVGLGPITHNLILALIGLGTAGLMFKHNIRGAIMMSILLVSLLAWATSSRISTAAVVSGLPGFVSMPSLRLYLFKFDFVKFLLEFKESLRLVLAFFCVVLFDVGGCIYGIGSLMTLQSYRSEYEGAEENGAAGGDVQTLHTNGVHVANGGVGEDDGENEEEDDFDTVVPPHAARICFTGVGMASILSAALGCSPVVIFLESSAGVKEGARTGLASLVTGVLFLIGLFFIPLFANMPEISTGPVLILIGALMMSGSSSIDWYQLDIALPCFLTIVLMPFTMDISAGIIYGLIFYLLLRIDRHLPTLNLSAFRRQQRTEPPPMDLYHVPTLSSHGSDVGRRTDSMRKYSLHGHQTEVMQPLLAVQTISTTYTGATSAQSQQPRHSHPSLHQTRFEEPNVSL